MKYNQIIMEKNSYITVDDRQKLLINCKDYSFDGNKYNDFVLKNADVYIDFIRNELSKDTIIIVATCSLQATFSAHFQTIIYYNLKKKLDLCGKKVLIIHPISYNNNNFVTDDNTNILYLRDDNFMSIKKMFNK